MDFAALPLKARRAAFARMDAEKKKKPAMAQPVTPAVSGGKKPATQTFNAGIPTSNRPAWLDKTVQEMVSTPGGGFAMGGRVTLEEAMIRMYGTKEATRRIAAKTARDNRRKKTRT